LEEDLSVDNCSPLCHFVHSLGVAGFSLGMPFVATILRHLARSNNTFNSPPLQILNHKKPKTCTFQQLPEAVHGGNMLERLQTESTAGSERHAQLLLLSSQVTPHFDCLTLTVPPDHQSAHCPSPLERFFVQ